MVNTLLRLIVFFLFKNGFLNGIITLKIIYIFSFIVVNKFFFDAEGREFEGQTAGLCFIQNSK